MERGLYDIEGAAVTTLINQHESRGQIKTISINNGHATDAATIDLYLQDSAGTPNTTYIVKNLVIPGGVTALLDQGLSFDNSRLSLIIKTVGGSIGASTPISVIIK